MNVTADEVKAAALAARIVRIEHHGCSICEYMTAYLIDRDQLFFDPGCYCSPRGRARPEPRDWSDAAEWINGQTSQEWRNKLRIAFGLEKDHP